MREFDYVLVGGGLQNSLIAMALLTRRPAARIALIERDSALGGNHTWSFHAGDLPAGAADFVAPLIAHRWQGYDIRFPGYSCRMEAPYASFTHLQLDSVVRARMATARGCAVRLGRTAVSIAAHSVTLDDGTVLEGQAVIDARGPLSAQDDGSARYQKFLGLELRVAQGAPGYPTLMDATVPQNDGFRFFYVLPLGPDRVLIEDTYYSDSRELDLARLRSEVLAYAADHGLTPKEVLREERGVLPLPLYASDPPPAASPFIAGYRGGWFHPTTGYSFPIAARLADLISKHAPDGMFGADYRELLRDWSRQAKFCQFLNRLLFLAASPGERWRVLEAFYRNVPADTIRRFYGCSLTTYDFVRVFARRPPYGVGIRAALHPQIWRTWSGR